MKPSKKSCEPIVQGSNRDVYMLPVLARIMSTFCPHIMIAFVHVLPKQHVKSINNVNQAKNEPEQLAKYRNNRIPKITHTLSCLLHSRRSWRRASLKQQRPREKRKKREKSDGTKIWVLTPVASCGRLRIRITQLNQRRESSDGKWQKEGYRRV